jgi:type II secretory pathway pseudopilin PulG
VDVEMNRDARAAGFSLVEALIAAAILLIIALGMIPLFSRAMINNTLGNDYTQATSHGTADVEEIWEAPLLNTDLVLTAGTSRQNVKYLMDPGFNTPATPATDLDWIYTPPTSGTDPVLWTRTTQLRQFHIDSLSDGELTDAEAVPAGLGPQSFQILEVNSQVDSGKLRAGNIGVFGGIRQTSFQYLKVF